MSNEAALTPICERCGHGAGSHNTTACNSYTGVELGPDGVPQWDTRMHCDCSGWKRDTGWGTDAEAER